MGNRAEQPQLKVIMSIRAGANNKSNNKTKANREFSNITNLRGKLSTQKGVLYDKISL